MAIMGENMIHFCDHGHYYNVVRTLIIQQTLSVGSQVVVVHYFLTLIM